MACGENGPCNLTYFVALQYDPKATGVIEYTTLMKNLLDEDYYALYI